MLSLQCRHGHPDFKTLKVFRYAHRGYHTNPAVPENSMKAFQLSIQNFCGAELDVHLMRDGHLAVVHDSNLKRVTGADVCIEDLTKEDLVNYPLFNTNETIPLLDDVLALFEGRTPLIIELKPVRGNHNELCSAVCRLLDQYHVFYCIESFDPRCLMWLKKNRPEIVRGQLVENFSRQLSGNQPAILMFLLKKLMLNFTTRPDFIAYRYQDRKNLPLKICRQCYHVQEVSWTIKSKEEMRQAESLGNIIIFEGFNPLAK